MDTTRDRQTQQEMLSLMTARVRDARLHAPLYVDADCDVVSVCRELKARQLTQALVRDVHAGEPRLGIFTTTDLRDALLRSEPPAMLPVRELANFELVSIDADSDVFEALWLMAQRRVHRLVVREGTQVLGMLDLLDLVNFVGHHSHLIALDIAAAHSVAELKRAAERIDATILLLHDSGLHVERIAHLVTAVNARLFERLWQLVASPALVANSCLLVMGSEGRGEQILRTDQDNALILRDGYVDATLTQATLHFNQALIDFGWPPCPGKIMLTTPLWCQSVSAFRDTVAGWLHGNEAEGPMRLAIFFDAAAVAGDASLLDAVRAPLTTPPPPSALYLAHFVTVADQFHEHGHWWALLSGRQAQQPLDLKKLGIFPIVHGVRALCLQHGVRELGTADRLQRLVSLQQLDAGLARELREALHFLTGLRLAHQLRQRHGGAAPGNAVTGAELDPLQHKPLREALDIVATFRLFLREHFQLDKMPN